MNVTMYKCVKKLWCCSLEVSSSPAYHKQVSTLNKTQSVRKQMALGLDKLSYVGACTQL